MCDWSEMFGGVKKVISGEQVSEPSPPPRPQRRPPSTPPLPLRRLQLVAKQPDTPVVLRGGRKVKGHRSGVRESWPGAGLKTPPSMAQPITEVRPRTTNQSQPHLALSACNPHWSVPARAPPTGRGSDSTMMSLLFFCHR